MRCFIEIAILLPQLLFALPLLKQFSVLFVVFNNYQQRKQLSRQLNTERTTKFNL